MSLQQLRNCNFGSNRSNATGSNGVGYTVLSTDGSTVVARTTSGVYQLTSGSGIYAAYITFPDGFRGQVLWDTGTAFLTASYAAEEYNVEANNPKIDNIDANAQSLYDMNFGKWQIVGNQMLFFGPDNSTEIARFNLFDEANQPTMDAVFKRVKV